MADTDIKAEAVDEELQAMLATLKLSKKKSKKKKTKAPSAGAGEGEGEGEGGDGEGESKVSKISIHDVGENQYSYQHMLDRIYTQIRANNPDLVNKKRAVLQPPEVMRVGTTKILWSNFPAISKRLGRDPEHIKTFFLSELGTTGNFDGNGGLLIKGKFVPKYIESLLKKYINEYVTCSMCRQVDTKLVRDPVSRMYFLHCSSCGASRAVSAIQKGYHATGRGERRAARNAA